MKKIIIALLLSLFVVPIASAHTLKTDGEIGAILHINPDDAPVANQPASFFFEITDTSNRFTLAECDCQMVILEGSKQVFTTAVTSASFSVAATNYTFLTPDVYTVELLGVPTTANAFQAFTMKYEVRVTGTTRNTSTAANASLIFLGLVVIGAIVGLYFAFRPTKKQDKSKTEK